jgi:ankyrin repeat protein
MTQARADLMDAIRTHDDDGVRRIITEAPQVVRTRGTDPADPSPLLWACYVRNDTAVALLTELAAPLDVFEAAAVGDIDRLKELLDADPTLAVAIAPDGFHPLGLAAFFGRPDAVALLVEHGADVNAPAQNANRVAALHSAVAAGAPGIVQFLLLHGADPDARQQGGITALMAAAHAGDTTMTRMLLDRDATVDLVDDDGRTAADYADEADAPDVLELLTVPADADAV